MRVSCEFPVERETEKAVYVEFKTGECFNTTKHAWLPKSACEIQTYVQTVNAYNQPLTYGKLVVKIDTWLLKKLK